MYRPLSRCGHLDFTPLQHIVTKLRLDEIIVWCHFYAMNVSIPYCYRNREHDQDGDSVIGNWVNHSLMMSSWILFRIIPICTSYFVLRWPWSREDIISDQSLLITGAWHNLFFVTSSWPHKLLSCIQYVSLRIKRTPCLLTRLKNLTSVSHDLAIMCFLSCAEYLEHSCDHYLVLVLWKYSAVIPRQVKMRLMYQRLKQVYYLLIHVAILNLVKFICIFL